MQFFLGVAAILSSVLLQEVMLQNVLHWFPMRQGDLPFMAVLYQSLQKTENHVDATLGRACGGAIVSSNKVLTLCACVRSFYLGHVHPMKADVDEEDAANNPEDKNSTVDIVAQDIYLTVWPSKNAEFIGDQKHVLSTNNFMSPSKCYDDVKSVSEGKKNVSVLQASVVVMMFSPGVTDPPAVKIPLDQVDLSIEIYINVFGMSKKNESEVILIEDQPYDPTAHAVEYKLDYLNATCPYTDYCKRQIFNDAIPKEYEQMKCLCTQKHYTIQICKGVPGFPITNGEDLIGLTASPVDCESGSVMAYLLDETTIKEISGGFNDSSEEPTVPTDLTMPEHTTPPNPNQKLLSTATVTKPILLNTANPVTAPNIVLFPILFYTYMICGNT